MRRLVIYLFSVLIITIIMPTVIVKTINFVPRENAVSGEGFDNNNREPAKIIISDQAKNNRKNLIDTIRVYNPYNDKVLEIDLEEYIKGVVSAEMPAEFHIEALKAQAIAARTYAVSRSIKYDQEGHPDHKKAPLCIGVHCQAYLSLDELKKIHGEEWEEKYWSKISEAVESTKGILIYYQGQIIEPLYHSTSGGMTEDVVNVYSQDLPYLKSVISPFEEESPKFKSITTMTGDEFVNKISENYSNAAITLENFYEKIKLIEKTNSGRIKKIAIGNVIIDGTKFRELFGLNSTNFIIAYDKDLNIIDITTYGYGHGVGMSQWGANGMANKGSNYLEILEHYYSGVEIR